MKDTVKKAVSRAGFGLLVAVLFLISACQKNAPTEPNKYPAHAFQLKNVATGDTLDLRDTYGQVVLLEFLQYDCPACQSEVPIMNQLYADYQEKDLVIWGVAFNSGDSTNIVDNFIKKFDVNYPVLNDNLEFTNIFVWQGYNVTSTPTFVIIGRDGYIKYFYDQSTLNRNEFGQVIDPLLDEPKPQTE